ncbi:BON domain-containing protein [Cupriavidus sp. AU9028]|uniref:BON domain-containing protein n=1 Tax=Cupriavidus sp. AU9028 TaxID=2871157 RepID=UPI001C9510CA|nr:BON domain-containing protein [Cupriavidus sp. AU9028]MBY4896068.1 BON domain-containing protein [Cupriavidus sp. AU9028]
MNASPDNSPNQGPGHAEGDQPATPADEDLLTQARQHVADEFGGAPPAGITLTIEDRRIRLQGTVQTVSVAERIAKAAAIGPGVLGVYNDLQSEEPPPESTAPPLARNPEGKGQPLEPPEGQIHHKV